jgi:hypothetical protein
MDNLDAKLGGYFLIQMTRKKNIVQYDLHSGSNLLIFYV